ncbi:hypothetical protein K1719_029242 [Acacia pycnantha]|nr:hypothetical protein K1719_029242 [Acacia pycnantha]
MPFDPYTNYTSPNDTVLCPDSFQSMYSQLLCGLCQNDQVLRVGAVFASGFIRAIKFLEYELVVTTYSGLYRYRVGDILRVAGFKNKAPQFNFVC